MSVTDSHKKYYEIQEFWNRNFFEDEMEKMRISAVISSIPEDVQSILEVGCGNGAIVNNIAKQRKMKRIVGVDISQNALSHVETEKKTGNISNLDFDDRSFDLVIASEVIEHLTYNDFALGLKEIERVSDKYILISVPNDENLLVNSRMCDKCFCWFNPDYHLSCFDNHKLNSLFVNFSLVWIKDIGPNVKSSKYSKFAAVLFHYLKQPEPKIGICPQCGYNYSKNKEEHSALAQKKRQIKFIKKKLMTFMNIVTKLFFSRKIYKKRWLVALYKRNSL